MKISYLLLFALFFSASVCGCGASKEPAKSAVEQRPPISLSPMARMLESDLRKLEREVTPSDTALINRYSLRRRGNTYCVSAFLTLDPPYADGELEQYGVLLQSVQGEMATALLSIREYLRLIDSRSLKAIEISPKAELR
jgi:hypothetical protein